MIELESISFGHAVLVMSCLAILAVVIGFNVAGLLCLRSIRRDRRRLLREFVRPAKAPGREGGPC